MGALAGVHKWSIWRNSIFPLDIPCQHQDVEKGVKIWAYFLQDWYRFWDQPCLLYYIDCFSCVFNLPYRGYRYCIVVVVVIAAHIVFDKGNEAHRK